MQKRVSPYRSALAALVCLTLLIGFIAACFSSSVTVDAGVSKVAIATTDSIKNTIATNVWVVEGNVIEGGKNNTYVDFGTDSADNARMIAIRSVNDISQDGVAKSVEAQYTFNTRTTEQNVTYADGSRFAFVYGLPSAFSELGAPGSVEVYVCAIDGEGNYFSSEDLEAGTKEIANADMAIGVQRFDEDGVAHQIAAPKKFSGVQFARQNSLSVTIENGKIEVQVKRGALTSSYSWQTVCTADAEGNSVQAGYTGMGRQGRARMRILTVEIEAWDYINAATPQSDSCAENFSNGSYNGNVWYSRAESNSVNGGIYVEDGTLVFRKVQKGYFGTCHSYSNFELTFDILHVQRKDEVSGSTLLYSKENNGYIGVSVGNDDYNERTYSTEGAYMYLLSSDGNVQSYESGERLESEALTSYTGLGNFWTEEYDGKTVSVKLSVIDGAISFMCKINSDQSDNGYVTLFTADFEDTPYGYVRILSENASNIILDNVKIVNLDANADSVSLDVGYAPNSLYGTEDFNYTDSWSDDDLSKFAR